MLNLPSDNLKPVKHSQMVFKVAYIGTQATYHNLFATYFTTQYL